MATVVALLSYLIKDIFMDFVSATGREFDCSLACSTRLWWASGKLIWRVAGMSVGVESWSKSLFYNTVRPVLITYKHQASREAVAVPREPARRPNDLWRTQLIGEVEPPG